MIKSKYITILLYIRRLCFLIIMDTTIKVKSSVFNHAIMHIYIVIFYVIGHCFLHCVFSCCVVIIDLKS